MPRGSENENFLGEKREVQKEKEKDKERHLLPNSFEVKPQ